MKGLRLPPLWIVFFIVLIDLVGFGIIIPVLPLLLTDPHSTFYILPPNVSIKHSYILFGLLVATYPMLQFFATPVLGILSDKYGRRYVLILSLLGSAISYALMAYAIAIKNLPLLFFARAFAGVTGGTISVAQAVVADITDPLKRTRDFGLLGAGFGIGLIIGPYIGGKLSDPGVLAWFSAQTPFWFAAIISLINMMAVMLVLPETSKRLHDIIHVHWFQSLRNIANAYRDRKLHVLYGIGFLYQCSFAFFTSFISVFLYKNFAFTQGSIGEYFAFAGLWIAFTQAIILKILHLRLRDDQIVKYGLVVCSVFIFMFFIVKTTFELYVITAVFAIANGLTQTGIISLVSRHADNASQGRILGINSSVYALAQTIPPALSGFIAASIQPETPITVSGFICIAATLAFFYYYKNVMTT